MTTAASLEGSCIAPTTPSYAHAKVVTRRAGDPFGFSNDRRLLGLLDALPEGGSAAEFMAAGDPC